MSDQTSLKGGSGMINFRRFFVIGIVAGIFLLCTGPGFGQEKKIVLRIADSFPPGHFMIRYTVKPWMEKVTKATNGLVEFQHYPSEQLGKAKDLLALTLSGVTDIGYVGPSYVTEKMPLSAVVELPGGFPSSCVGTKAHWSLAKEGLLYQKELAPNGIRLLFHLSLPPYQLLTRKKFETLKDVENLKLRTAGGAMDLTVRHLKAVPVRMPAPEIYEAVSRGTLDGGVLPIASVVAYKWGDVFKFSTIGQNFGSFVLDYVISDKRWKTLPPNVQKAMLEAGEEVTMSSCVNMDKDEQENFAKLAKEGMTMVRLSPADDSTVKTQTGEVALDWAKGLDAKGKPGSQVLKAFREAVEKVR
jgi:TRAP-type C4-dicarboxylate transport system substrate-binding protein